MYNEVSFMKIQFNLSFLIYSINICFHYIVKNVFQLTCLSCTIVNCILRGYLRPRFFVELIVNSIISILSILTRLLWQVATIAVEITRKQKLDLAPSYCALRSHTTFVCAPLCDTNCVTQRSSLKEPALNFGSQKSLEHREFSNNHRFIRFDI